MDISLFAWIILTVITLIGAIAQSAIGFGFSLMAVPFFLLVLDVKDAVQLSMVLTMAITIIMVFYIYRDIPKNMAINLLLGSVLGFPIGLVFFVYASPDLIKLVVAITIVIALAASAWKKRVSSHMRETRGNALIAGIVSGAMVTSIAMAGPAIAIYLQALGAGKTKTRAVIFCVFFFSYSCAILMQGFFNGFEVTAIKTSLYLLPVIVVGILVGRRLSDRISEKRFNQLISAILILVALYLMYSAL